MEFVRISKAASRLARGNRLNNKYFLKTRVKCRKFMRANFRAKLNCFFLCSCVKMDKEKAQLIYFVLNFIPGALSVPQSIEDKR